MVVGCVRALAERSAHTAYSLAESAREPHHGVIMSSARSLQGLCKWLQGMAALVAGLIPLDARAAQPEGIPVYSEDINKPGQFGLELHLNTTPSGRTVPDYPGEITNNHGFRFTPEFSYGLRSDVELGLYLPMLIDGDGEYHFVGVKYRLKWLPIRPKEDGEGWFAGTNSELSRVDY